MDISSNEDSDVATSEPVLPRCSYCSKEKSLVKGKTYCFDCSDNCFRECKRCKRPFHDKKYYSFSETRCNSCHKKYLKEKAKREEKKKKTEEQGRVILEKQTKQKIAGYIPVFMLNDNESECD